MIRATWHDLVHLVREIPDYLHETADRARATVYADRATIIHDGMPPEIVQADARTRSDWIDHAGRRLHQQGHGRTSLACADLLDALAGTTHHEEQRP